MKALVIALIVIVTPALGFGIYFAVQANDGEIDRKIAACQEGWSPADDFYHMCAIRHGR